MLASRYSPTGFLLEGIMSKLTINPKTIKKYQTQAENLLKGLAKETSENLENEYLDIIDNFYMEYDPEYYIRHKERGDYSERGMDRTYEKILEEKRGTEKDSFIGGIRITTKNMYDGYRGTHEQVLRSFLSGFHGLPTWHGLEKQFPPIRSNIVPQRELLNYMEHELEPEMRKRAKFKK